MSKTRITITMSLDGYVAGPNQSVKEPLGVGGEALHDWAVKLAAFNELQGKKGGEVNANSAIFQEMFENVGAVIMGRNMFGGGPGPWTPDWKGWWGANPPYHMPVFVLTHHTRDPLPMQGGTTFHFVTDGIQSALNQGKRAAAAKDVLVMGGANTIQQFLAAGLIDEVNISMVPLLLGGGERLLD
ncbi:MAG TPA: dihydrofolate reductase family protein, partial [Gemmatimonadaceae bacterium]|nr:dihydrofolate reductase family protein [Gemmatimonadaceae bacterium]